MELNIDSELLRCRVGEEKPRISRMSTDPASPEGCGRTGWLSILILILILIVIEKMAEE